MSARRCTALAAALLAAVAFAACGGGSSGNGVASKSPEQIIAAVQVALKTVRSVHVHGTMTTGGQATSLDFRLLAGKGGEGSMSLSGLDFRLVTTGGTIYLNGNQAFWRQLSGAAGARLFSGKWVKAPAHGRLDTFSQLTSITALFGQLASNHGVLKKGSTTSINGRPAIGITDTTRGGTLYVATTGQPVPLLIQNNRQGNVAFDQYNQPVSLSPPKNAVDLAHLQGGGV